jgi:hypothetical protein
MQRVSDSSTPVAFMGVRPPRMAAQEEALMRQLNLTGVVAAALALTACATSTRIRSAPGEVAPVLYDPIETLDLPPVMVTPGTTEMSVLPVPTMAFSNTSLAVGERVRMLDETATGIDRSIAATGASVRYDETVLSDDDLRLSGSRWGRVQRWYDWTGSLRKVRTIPADGGLDTEEYYFDNGHLILAYWNPVGASEEDTFELEEGEVFYFGRDGLLAWVRDDGTDFYAKSPDGLFWEGYFLDRARRMADCCGAQ